MEGETLRQALRDAGKTQRQLAAYMAFDPAVITRIVQGARGLTPAEEDRIREFLGAGEGAGVEPKFGPVPVYGVVTGAPRDKKIHLDHGSIVRHTRRHPNQEGLTGAFAVEVYGETMAPRYEHRELAFAVRDRWPRRFEDCLVEFNDGSTRIKRFLGDSGNVLSFMRLNPEEEFGIAAREIKALHTIVGRG